jgi:lipoprotein NlpI
MRRGRSAIVLALVAFASCAFAQLWAQETAPTKEIKSRLEALSADIKKHPSDVAAITRRAELYAALGRPEQAIADYDRLIELEPDRAAWYDARGSEHFKRGKIEASIADFDRALKLQPDQEPWHWKRGISYYYAAQWDAGQRQFEGYQTVDDNDVENAVWRYLCMARGQGVEPARKAMLAIKRDLRVPMMEVYDLYRGQLEPDDVLRAASAGEPAAAELNQRLFYAHLYLGLYYEVGGDAVKAKQHLELATQHKIGHYMWNVADVHAKRLASAENTAK